VDLDGCSSIVLAEYYIRPITKEVHYLCTDYDKIEDEVNLDLVKKSDYILFTDIAPTKELYDKIKEIQPNIYIFDHHSTSKDNLGEDVPNYIYDSSRSGTKIFFDWLTKGMRVKPIVKEFVDLVDTYDLYKKDSELFKIGKCLNTTLYANANYYREEAVEKYKMFIYAQVKKFDTFDKYRFTSSELKKIKEDEIKEKKAYELARKKLKYRKDENGDTYMYTESRTKVSAVASKLLEENPHVSYIAVYATYEPKALKISLRSLGYNTTKISESFGGGGHENGKASSFNFGDRKNFDNFVLGKKHLV
jgi:oligoribonuclease NrnB/cAMP/cGMP phosphodiesterase (DHH superfamily)